MPDSEYVISSFVQDGMLFEMITGAVEVDLVKYGEIKELIVEPRVRITKAQDAPSQ